ncbi:hypothetical protein [Rhodococcus sp. 1168]|uniref:hypothetical protein n=1 Tax=Rhodococcus sp. 1168 TaxID=2018041 RepID=UPI000A0A5711|nr:hypothetical protein [Rhodococcus sp. 1168]ORI13419.1 hypothetical protein BJI47_22510 [Rhodococcus sp. 1168]
MALTADQLIEFLAHNADNSRNDDIWLLHDNGDTEIVPDQDIAEFQNPHTWPKYICRSAAVNNIIQDRSERLKNSPESGLQAGLDFLNLAIRLTGIEESGSPVKAMASLTRSAITSGYRAIRGSKTTS